MDKKDVLIKELRKQLAEKDFQLKELDAHVSELEKQLTLLSVKKDSNNSGISPSTDFFK